MWKIVGLIKHTLLQSSLFSLSLQFFSSKSIHSFNSTVSLQNPVQKKAIHALYICSDFFTKRKASKWSQVQSAKIDINNYKKNPPQLYVQLSHHGTLESLFNVLFILLWYKSPLAFSTEKLPIVRTFLSPQHKKKQQQKVRFSLPNKAALVTKREIRGKSERKTCSKRKKNPSKNQQKSSHWSPGDCTSWFDWSKRRKREAKLGQYPHFKHKSSVFPSFESHKTSTFLKQKFGPARNSIANNLNNPPLSKDLVKSVSESF